MRDADFAIAKLARDYYEAWFEGDADRMGRSLHPRSPSETSIAPMTPYSVVTSAKP